MLVTLLFFVVAMAFSIYCWAKHQGTLGLLSFLLWFLFVVYCWGLSLTQWDLHYDFAMFGVLMGIIVIFTSIYMIIQSNRLPGDEEEEEKPRDVVEEVYQHRKRIREAKNRMRGYGD